MRAETSQNTTAILRHAPHKLPTEYRYYPPQTCRHDSPKIDLLIMTSNSVPAAFSQGPVGSDITGAVLNVRSPNSAIPAPESETTISFTYQSQAALGPTRVSHTCTSMSCSQPSQESQYGTVRTRQTHAAFPLHTSKMAEKACWCRRNRYHQSAFYQKKYREPHSKGV